MFDCICISLTDICSLFHIITYQCMYFSWDQNSMKNFEVQFYLPAEYSIM